MAEESKNKYKILLVDDDQFILNMYAIKFKKAGYDTNLAASASVALEKLRAGEQFDAVIFDVVMPGMDGFEFAETIKSEKLAAHSSLIALTNQSQSTDIERGNKIGIDGYIVKASVIPSEIIKEVGVILEKKKS